MSSLLSTQTRWTPWLIAAALLGPSALSFGAEAVRLGILAESPEVATAADFLTAELSNEPGVGLVEREQISRVLKEQSLSASHGSDFVKLGEVLGADGLLFLEVVARGTNQVVSSRLAAVKPGVVLDLAEYAYPLPEPEQWSRMLARRMKPLFPKLGVLTKDAVPISFLNLRAAVKSADSEVLERRLSQVLVSRLAGQPEVFVLERQKLQALAQEKDLKGVGKEPFWNGSYLLEGIIDKGGFTKSSVTINVRLTPPRQGTPFDFELTGPREEAPSLTMAVAERVLARLKGQTRLQDWKASDEAERYFMEARWAWRWSMVPEALAAADSAWALGHNDQECGTIRVQAATSLAIHETPLEQQQHMLHSIFSPSAPRQPARIAELRDIEMAKRSLWNYDELRGLLAVGEIGMDSPVFVLGIQTLNEASKLLRTVYGNDELARDMEDPLAELRSGLRDVAGWLSKLPSVRAAYWPAGDAPIREGPVREALMMKQDLLSCELQYARLWFERPEDCLSLYREIMSSPGF
ncbi:MAG TPA: hypothetical protein VLT36_22695, partial [Candidatus Dormibacteraeota bacterium]|nr:hypothetical protein [Candidatus Dormibacteraeota bacterium]